MILINVKFPIKPEYAEEWPQLAAPFTEATRAEPGNLFFDWFRSVDDPHTYVVIEGFEDDAAEAHVQSAHFQQMQQEFPQYLSATPTIINTVVPESWGPMGELSVD